MLKLSKEGSLQYLNEQSMQEAAGNAGDVGCDDLDVERLEQIAQLDHGVSLLVAGDAYNHGFLPNFSHFKLHAMPPKQIIC